ncbi:type II secretion system F family protein [Catellatospora tritici]|uniref:type II secretion system F family protein n=1 Tax=Catellatospora tritici TaxID=2851566 RepID=UPI001C2D9BF5|nr:type II secretion system F family protein [Catellatospora tritici]MBV1852171.1 type II secretion system F family protein [Catellatospora tritici]
MSEQLILNIGVIAIFAAIVLAVITLVSGSVGRAGVAKALESIDHQYAPGSAAPSEESLFHRLRPASRQFSSVGQLVAPKGTTARVQRHLDLAGNPAGWPPERVVEIQGLALLLLGLAGAGLGLLLGLSGGGILLTTLIAAALGFGLPMFVVYDLGLRRQQTIRHQLPEALDLLTLSVEAGLGFDAALVNVASTMPGPLAREFARVLHEMQMGQRRVDALRALGTRTSVGELKTFSTALAQAGELGIPIAGVLRAQAKQMRVKRRQLAEEAARKLPVKVLFPLVLCLLPALFIVVIGPGAINIMNTFFDR